jgi:hypothetical protein
MPIKKTTSKEEEMKLHQRKKKQSKNPKQWICCIIGQFCYNCINLMMSCGRFPWKAETETETCCDNIKINNKIIALDSIYCEPNTYLTGCNTPE